MASPGRKDESKRRRRHFASIRKRPENARQAGRRPLRRYELQARHRLRRFRQHTLVAVSLVALILLTLQPAGETFSLDQAPAQNSDAGYAGMGAAQDQGDPSPENFQRRHFDPGTAAEEATGTVRDIFSQAYGMWPKFAIAVLILLFAWGLARLIKFILRKVLHSWNRAEAFSAFSGVIILLLALGTALSVIAGDVRALVGSVGLVGLALSWALQSPIESFTGWMLNSFKGYYRVGDRIAVGEVFGDVYIIDILTTTVWESGGPDRPVQGAQPTGAMVTFPNSEVLRNNITNYTKDFPYVWDEITINLANESDFSYALEVIEKTAVQVAGTAMAMAVEEYRALLKERKLLFDVSPEPQVYASSADSWTDFTIRYLVPARERRHWASRFFLAITKEISRPEHAKRIFPAAPRLQMKVLDPEKTESRGGQDG
ncbi:MAG: mechanosensitive ion channel [Desulfobulbaceae bacterium]|nr:mechanosensitive ion channel [Desulfobulbaceae bacterium]